MSEYTVTLHCYHLAIFLLALTHGVFILVIGILLSLSLSTVYKYTRMKLRLFKTNQLGDQVAGSACSR